MLSSVLMDLITVCDIFLFLFENNKNNLTLVQQRKDQVAMLMETLKNLLLFLKNNLFLNNNNNSNSNSNNLFDDKLLRYLLKILIRLQDSEEFYLFYFIYKLINNIQ
jgi:hypothetical protein